MKTDEKLEVIGMRPEEYINTLPETGIPVYTVESTRPLTISDGDANADDNSDKGNNHQRSGYGSDEESSPVLDHAIFIQSSEVTIRNVDRQNTTRKVFKLAPLVEERKSDKHL